MREDNNKVEFDEYDLDSFEFDNMDELDIGYDEDRTAVENLKKGFYSSTKQELEKTSTWIHFFKEALPEGYSKAYNLGDSLIDDASELYNIAAKDLKPLTNTIKRTVNKVPSKLKQLLPKKIQEDLEAFEQEENQKTPETPEQLKQKAETSDIRNGLNSVFSSQIKVQTELAEQERAQTLIQDTIENNQRSELVDNSSRLIAGIDKIVGYQDNILIKYHKKSLELQYRQYFITRDLLQTAIRYNAKSLDALSAIVKNSALPDAVKITKSEMAKQMLTERLLGSGLNTISKFTANFRQNFKTSAKDFVSGFFNTGEVVADAAGKLTDEISRTNAYDIGVMLSGKVTEEVSKHLAGILAPMLGNQDDIKKYGSMAGTKLTNIEQNLSEWAKTPTQDTSPLKAWAIDLFKTLIPKRTRNDEITKFKITDTDKPSVWDALSRKTLVEIIPAYLSKIAHWTKATATGSIDDNPEVYNVFRGGFTTKTNSATDFQREIIGKRDSVTLKGELENYANFLTKGTEISPEAKQALMRQILVDANEKNFDPSRLSTFSGYDRSNGTQEQIEELIDAITARFDTDYSGEYLNDTADNWALREESQTRFKSLTALIPDLKNRIDALADISGREILRDMGYIERHNRKDRYNIEKVYDLLLGTDAANYIPKEALIGPNGKVRLDSSSETIADYNRKVKERESRLDSDEDADIAFNSSKPSATANLANLQSPTLNVENLKLISPDATAFQNEVLERLKSIDEKKCNCAEIISTLKEINVEVREGNLNKHAIDHTDLLRLIKELLDRPSENPSPPTKEKPKEKQTPTVNSEEIINYIKNIFTEENVKKIKDVTNEKYLDTKEYTQEKYREIQSMLTEEKLKEFIKEIENKKETTLENFKENETVKKYLSIIEEHKSSALNLKENEYVKNILNLINSTTENVKNTASEKFSLFAEQAPVIYSSLKDGTGSIFSAMGDQLSKLNGLFQLNYDYEERKIDLLQKILFSTKFIASKISGADPKETLSDLQSSTKAEEAIQSSARDKMLDGIGGAIKGTAKGVGKAALWYGGKVFDFYKFLFKGGSKVLGLAAEGIGAAIKGIYNFATEKDTKGGDIYVLGQEEPALLKKLMDKDEYIDKKTTRYVKTIEDITGPVRNLKGDIVLTQEEFDKGIYEGAGNSRMAKAASVAGGLIKGYFKITTAPMLFAGKLAWSAGKGILEALEGPSDGYLKGENKPRIYAKLIKEGFYVDKNTGKTIEDYDDITGDVLNRRGDVVVTDEEIQNSGGFYSIQGKLLRGAGQMLKGLAKAAWWYTKKVGKVYSAIGKGIVGAVKGIGKGIGLLFGSKSNNQKFGAGEFSGDDVKDLLHLNFIQTKIQEKILNFLLKDSKDRTKRQDKEIKDWEQGLAKNKKADIEDADNDGFEDGSLEEIRNKKKLKENKEKDKPKDKEDKEKDGNSGFLKTLLGIIPAAFMSIKSGFEKISDLITSFGQAKAAGGIADAVGDMLSDGPDGKTGRSPKPKGTVGKMWEATKTFGKKVASSGVGKLIFNKTVGKVLIGAGVVALGTLGSPLAAVAGTAATVYGGVDMAVSIYDYFKDKEPGVLTKLRFVQYGIEPNSDQSSAIIELEKLLTPKVRFNGDGVGTLDTSSIKMNQVLSLFEIKIEDDSDDAKELLSNWVNWYNTRFVPVFVKHLEASVKYAKSTSLITVDEKVPTELGKDFVNYVSLKELANAFNQMVSPFEDEDLEYSYKDVKAAIDEALSFYDAKEKVIVKDKDTLSNITGQTLSNKDTKASKETINPETNSVEIKMSQDLNKSQNLVASSVVSMLTDVTSFGGMLSIIKSTLTGSLFFNDAKQGSDTLAVDKWVRLKTYGLVTLDSQKVNALLHLEKDALDFVEYDSDKIAYFKGNVTELYQKHSTYFEVKSDQQKIDWYFWFNHRFIPTLLSFATACKHMKNEHPLEAVKQLTDNQLKTVLMFVVNTTYDQDGKFISVFEFKVSPWTKYNLNSDKQSVIEMISKLNGKAGDLKDPNLSKEDKEEEDKKKQQKKEQEKTWYDKIVDTGKGLWEGGKNAIKAGVEKTKEVASSTYEAVKETAATVGTKVIAASTAITEGVKAGAKKIFGNKEEPDGMAGSGVPPKPSPGKVDKVVTAVNTTLPPEARALLDTISGTESPGYNVRYHPSKRNVTFDDYSKHPDLAETILKGENAGKTSDAAGRYQFLNTTWSELARIHKVKDFSPMSQDFLAWEYAKSQYKKIKGRNLLEDLKSQDPKIKAGIGTALSGTWTSLPGGIEATTNTSKFNAAYDKHLAKITGLDQKKNEQAIAEKAQVASSTPSDQPTSSNSAQTPQTTSKEATASTTTPAATNTASSQTTAVAASPIPTPQSSPINQSAPNISPIQTDRPSSMLVKNLPPPMYQTTVEKLSSPSIEPSVSYKQSIPVVPSNPISINRQEPTQTQLPPSVQSFIKAANATTEIAKNQATMFDKSSVDMSVTNKLMEESVTVQKQMATKLDSIVELLKVKDSIKQSQPNMNYASTPSQVSTTGGRQQVDPMLPEGVVAMTRPKY